MKKDLKLFTLGAIFFLILPLLATTLATTMPTKPQLPPLSKPPIKLDLLQKKDREVLRKLASENSPARDCVSYDLCIYGMCFNIYRSGCGVGGGDGGGGGSAF